MRLYHWVFTAGLMSVAASAQAIPNMWTSGFGQGVSEYIITSKEKTEFNLNCTSNPDENEIYQHGVYVTLPNGTMVSSHDEKTSITVVMDDQQFSLPSFLGWRNGDNAWYEFISTLKTATQFDVYVGEEKVGSYQVSLKNAQKTLPDASECGN